MKPRWLDRRIAAPGPYLRLCLSEAEFAATMKAMKVASYPHWAGSDASTHMLRGPRGATCVVCIDGWEGRDPVEVAGLLVHEAVHVWQDYAESIGEKVPGSEQEAYGIQAIAQELMAEFSRRMVTR